MDKLSFENESIELQALEKHRYPMWLYVFFLFLLTSFLYVVPSFLLNDLPHHCELNQKLANAQKCFFDKDYANALSFYNELLEKYPNFKEARVKAIKSCFALVSQNLTFYFEGIDLLGEIEYTTSDISEMIKFLPAKYHNHFHSLFQTKRK